MSSNISALSSVYLNYIHVNVFLYTYTHVAVLKPIIVVIIIASSLHNNYTCTCSFIALLCACISYYHISSFDSNVC